VQVGVELIDSMSRELRQYLNGGFRNRPCTKLESSSQIRRIKIYGAINPKLLHSRTHGSWPKVYEGRSVDIRQDWGQAASSAHRRLVGVKCRASYLSFGRDQYINYCRSFIVEGFGQLGHSSRIHVYSTQIPRDSHHSTKSELVRAIIASMVQFGTKSGEAEESFTE